MKQVIWVFLVAVVIAVVAACGGGGGASLAGIDRLGVSNGTISGFGSIIVNGVEYETNNASFTVDDAPGGQDDLQVGQVVTINWSTSDNGATFHAETVTYDAAVEGPITASTISVITQSFEVLGQLILVNPDTSFDPNLTSGFGSLQDGDFVEVSGFYDSAGRIRATRIEKKTAGSEMQVRGVVGVVSATTFTINSLIVDFGTVPATLVGGVPVTGDFVEAKGMTVNGLGQLVATEVRIEDQSGDNTDEGDEGELEGYVTAFTSATEFSVSGVPVDAAGATVTGGTVALNVKVEVEGQFNVSGVLVASRVKVRSGSGGSSESNAEIQANVVSVNVAAGTLVVAGVTVRVDELTRLEDQRANPVRPFTLADIAVGDYVEVRGIAQPDNSVKATLLQREDADTEGELRGPVGSAASPNLTVLGVAVSTDGGTSYSGADNSPLTAVEFFNAIGTGTVVKVVFGNPPGTPILADEIEIKFQND